MNKSQEVAHEIIDLISQKIMEHYNIKPKNLTDDEIKNPALLNGTVYYDIEDKIIDKLNSFEQEKQKSEGFFIIPHMVVHRDDIISQYEDSEIFDELKEQINNLTDEEMEKIADDMTDTMMEDFNVACITAFEKVKGW